MVVLGQCAWDCQRGRLCQSLLVSGGIGGAVSVEAPGSREPSTRQGVDRISSRPERSPVGLTHITSVASGWCIVLEDEGIDEYELTGLSDVGVTGEAGGIWV